MNKIIFCLLLISGLPVLINGTLRAKMAEEKIEECLGSGSNIIDSNIGKLVFLNEKWLGSSEIALVKKGTYNDIEVAIKITWMKARFDQELAAYEALNAIQNEEIEKYGIPRIYYHGKIIGGYWALAMTPLQETLGDRYVTQKKPLSELAIALIMKQAVQTLAYLALNKVKHNDIKPDNIFLRDAEVFIADFGLTTLKNEQTTLGSSYFASASYFAKRDRHAVDDLESLVYSMWLVAGFEMGFTIDENNYYPEGYLMFRFEERREVVQKMRDKCNLFKEKELKHAFEYICIQEILPRKPIPNYDAIIPLLTGTISEITKNSDKTTYEWLDKPPARRTLLFEAILSKLGKKKR